MNVTVIGRHSCQPCRATMRRLQYADAYTRFVDIDQLQPDSRWQPWLTKAPPGTSLPIVIVQNAMGSYIDEWTGYRPDRIDALASLR